MPIINNGFSNALEDNGQSISEIATGGPFEFDYKHSLIDSSTGTKCVFEQDPMKFYSNIYDNYQNIVSVVELIFNYTLQEYYNAFDKWSKIINANNEKFTSLIKNYDKDVKQDTIRTFKDFINKFNFKDDAYNNNETPLDISSIIDLDGVNNIISELLIKIREINWRYGYSNDETLVFNIKNSTVFKGDNPFYNQITFNVSPVLTQIIKSGIDDVNLNPSLFILKYVINIDFNSFFNLVSHTAQFPTDPESIFDKETFVANNMTNYTKYIEDIAKRIIIEVMDVRKNTLSNFDKFNSKVTSLCKDILKSSDNQNIIGKVKYLLKSHLGSTTESMQDPQFQALFNKIDNRNLLKDALDHYENRSLFSGYSPLTSFSDAVIYSLQDNGYSSVDKTICTIYDKAFSLFFSSTVSWSIDWDYKPDNILTKTSKMGYSREFDKKYDLVELYNDIGKLSDYNLRDFYQQLIRTVKVSSYYTPSYSKKAENGEKQSFLASKARRFVVLYALAFTIFIKKVISYVECLNANKTTYFTKVFSDDEQLNSSLITIIKNTLSFIINYIANISQIDTCLFIPSNYSIREIYNRGYTKLAYMLSVLGKYNDEIVQNNKFNYKPLIDLLELDKDHKESCFKISYDLSSTNDDVIDALHKYVDQYIIGDL